MQVHTPWGKHPIDNYSQRYLALLISGSRLNAKDVIHLRVTQWIPYSGKLSQRKLSRIARLCRAKGCHTPKFHGENFCEQQQNRERREGFLPQKVSHYTVYT